MNDPNLVASLKSAIADVDSENIGWAKLLVSLSSGSLILSPKIATVETTLPWTITLLLGNISLLVSLLAGIFYLRRRLEWKGQCLQEIMNKPCIREYENKNPGLKVIYEGKEITAREYVKELKRQLIEATKRKSQLDKSIPLFFLWQMYSFYLGVLLVAVFGIFNMFSFPKA